MITHWYPKKHATLFDFGIPQAGNSCKWSGLLGGLPANSRLRKILEIIRKRAVIFCARETHDMKRKSLSDILLHLFFGAALVTDGVLTLRYASAGAIVSCRTAKLKTVLCVITEHFAFSQQIIEEKSIDEIIAAKVATITAT
jgi:hypothetical protein